MTTGRQVPTVAKLYEQTCYTVDQHFPRGPVAGTGQPWLRTMANLLLRELPAEQEAAVRLGTCVTMRMVRSLVLLTIGDPDQLDGTLVACHADHDRHVIMLADVCVEMGWEYTVE